MLPEIVHVPNSHDAFGSDGFVVRFDALWNPGRAEFSGGLRANPSQRGPALIRWRCNLRVRTLDISQQIVDLLGDNVCELRIGDQLGSQIAGPSFPSRGLSMK